MREILLSRFQKYLENNNPDILYEARKKGIERGFLYDRLAIADRILQNLTATGTPAYIVEEICLGEITKEFRPSKYDYISSILEDEFEDTYLDLEHNEALMPFISNTINRCQIEFEKFEFSEETEQNRWLRYAVMGIIDEQLLENPIKPTAAYVV